jgi:FkbM family methyltransferase
MKHFIDLGTHLFEGLEEFITKLGIDNTFCVYCYEPNKFVYDKSKEISEKYKNKFIIFEHNNIAVMNYTGEITFNSHKGAWKSNGEYNSDYDYGSNCLTINPNRDVACGAVFDIIQYKCECLDINDILNKIYNFDKDAIIYIKCDVEGSEFEILPKILDSPYKNLIKELHIEWHERFWYETPDYNKKVFEKKQIINTFKNLNITCYDHH